MVHVISAALAVLAAALSCSQAQALAQALCFLSFDVNPALSLFTLGGTVSQPISAEVQMPAGQTGDPWKLILPGSSPASPPAVTAGLLGCPCGKPAGSLDAEAMP